MADLTNGHFDADAAAQELAARIADHLRSVGQRVSAPDSRPLFTKAADGAIVDREGKTVREAPATK